MTKLPWLTVFIVATLTYQTITIPAHGTIESSTAVQKKYIRTGDRPSEIARTTKKNKTERAAAEIAQINTQLAQNSTRIIITKQTLATNKNILREIRPAVEEGAISAVQLTRQQQHVNDLTLQLEELMKERRILLIERKKLLSNTPKYRKRQSDS
jgi:outer membrane protein TolC